MTKNRAEIIIKKSLILTQNVRNVKLQNESKASQFRYIHCCQEGEQQMANFLLFEDISGWQRCGLHILFLR